MSYNCELNIPFPNELVTGEISNLRNISCFVYGREGCSNERQTLTEEEREVYPRLIKQAVVNNTEIQVNQGFNFLVCPHDVKEEIVGYLQEKEVLPRDIKDSKVYFASGHNGYSYATIVVNSGDITQVHIFKYPREKFTA